MSSFEDSYRSLFQSLGYPLSGRAALSPRVLEQAEERLGVRVPAALRDYYLVAGRERRFNTCVHRLLPPSEWAVDKQRLIFMAENQSVCCWGVSVRSPDSDDPPVSEGVEDEAMSWSPLSRKCSAFLTAMLHHQAASGGLPHRSRKFLGETTLTKNHLLKTGWTYHGELKGEKMYGRPNQVLCLASFDLPIRRGWMASAGGKTRRDLLAVEAELGLDVG